jgi:mono/diheme cytochrome c family protein
MIPASMSRPAQVLLILTAAVVVTALTTACGTEKISVPKSNPNHAGAVLFNQRCGGCHTLSYAATNGSASNARSREVTNGPNFNVRCERPVDRVLYAIENGGFSGAIMPQNVVVGQQAIEVAKFVAIYAGRQVPKVPGVVQCQQQPIGTIPSNSPAATTATPTASAPAATAKATPRAAGKTGGTKARGTKPRVKAGQRKKKAAHQ